MSLTLERGSLEYVRVPVAADGLDLTVDTVEMAFTTGAAPTNPDWQTAGWDDGSARVLVGPGGTIELAHGTWQIWVRVVDNPEVPVLRAGYLVIR